MYSLDLADAFKYSGGDVYVFDLIPTGAGLFAIASDQSLNLFDPANLRQGPLKNTQTKHGNLKRAAAYSAMESVVCTAGENGFVSVWDWRLDTSRAEALRLEGGAGVPAFLSLACRSETHVLVAGTELANHQASIIVWDVRSPSAPRLHYNEVHSDDITELAFHPSHPSLLLSASTDFLISLTDLSIADPDESTLQQLNHGSSVHRSGFLGESVVYALSHDEKLALYGVREESISDGKPLLHVGDVRAALGEHVCRYVTDVVAKSEGGAVVGVGAQDHESFQLFHMAKMGAGDDSWGLAADNTVDLPRAHGSELVRAFYLDDPHQVVYTSGEDGCIKAWRPGSQ